MPAAELTYAIEQDRANDYEAASQAYTRAVKAALSLDDLPVASEALRRHGTMLSRRGAAEGFDEAVDLVQRARELDEGHNLQGSLFQDLLSLVYVYRARGTAEDRAHIVDVQERANEVAELMGNAADPRQLAFHQIEQGRTLRDSYGDADASRLWNQALLSNDEIKLDPRLQAYVTFNIGARYLDTLQFDNAKAAFAEAHDLWASVDDQRIFKRDKRFWLCLARAGEVEASLISLEMHSDADALTSARQTLATLSTDEAAAAEFGRDPESRWTLSFLQTYADSLSGEDVSQALVELVNTGPTAEQRFNAGHLLARTLSKDPGRNAAARSAAESALSETEPSFCTIPLLRTRYDELSASLPEASAGQGRGHVACD